MTDDQYFGLEEWPRDVRYYNCRSQKAFSNADGERKGEPFLGVNIPRMPALAWKAFDYMKSRHDPRMRDLSKELKDWYRNVSWIATTLLRGHVRTQKQRNLLWREADGLSVRWSGLCNAIRCDRYYEPHPRGAQVNTQQILNALHHGGFDNPRYLIGFPANEWGATAYDAYDVRNTTEHIWPVWNGYAENPDICERNYGPMFIKPVGGEVNWDAM